MILTGHEIRTQIEQGNIVVNPFVPGRINPNSIDISMGNRLLRYTSSLIDPRIETEVEEIEIPPEGYVLQPGSFTLGSSREKVGSTKFVPLVHAKSSIARAGLFVHVTADLIDIGSIGTITLQLYSTLAFRVIPGMLVGQMTFWRPTGEIELYHGKYQHSDGPRKSMIFKDQFWSSL